MGSSRLLHDHRQNLDPWIRFAEIEVRRRFGVRVSATHAARSLVRFGRLSDLDMETHTIADLGVGEAHETYLTTNGITSVVSSDDSDTEPLIIQGLTIDGDGNFIRESPQSIVLAGQTPVSLDIPLARVDQKRNTGPNDLVGEVFSFQGGTTTNGVPDDPATIHSIIPAGKNITFKMALTVPNDEFFFAMLVIGSVRSSPSPSDVDFDVEFQTKGGTFTQGFHFNLTTRGGNSSVSYPLRPYVIAPPNTDIRIVAESGQNNQSVSAVLVGVFAELWE